MNVIDLSKREDISFDLETFGTKQGSYISAIGVAKFDIRTGEIQDTLYMKTRCPEKEFNIDIATIQWWMKQDERAREEIYDANRMHIYEALKLIEEFVGAKSFVWGNGAAFDIALLESAFEKMFPVFEIPWKFWNVQDMRTIVNVAEYLGFNKKRVPREGDHHNALHDAIHQAKIISQAFQTIINGGTNG